MDIQALRAFKTIAELGSFSAAAQTLFITQPAISKRIQNLESQLGISLFHRVNRTIKLTQAGITLLPKAKLIIREIEEAERTLSHYGEENIGILKLGISHHIGLHRLPPVLKLFSNKFPKATLDLSFVDSETGFQNVINGDLELGLVTLPSYGTPDLNLITKEIWKDPLSFCISHEHPLNKANTLSLESLSELEAILPNQNTFTYKIINGLFEKQNLALNTSLHTNNLETIRMLVSVGLGWSVLPNTLMQPSINQLTLNETLTRSLGYVVHSKRTLSNPAQRFIDLLENEISSLG